MSTRDKRLQELETRMSTTASEPFEEWRYVVTIGGANPGTKLVHHLTGEDCTDTAKVHEAEAYYRGLAKTGTPVDIRVTIGTQEAGEGGAYA
jgi:hypothetical protein